MCDNHITTKMESGPFPLTTESQTGCNHTTDDVEMQRIWELTKIGNFNSDSWKIILSHLSDTELANVALVCKDFQLMAENIIDKRYGRGYDSDHLFTVSFGDTKWKPIICRFRKVISHVTVYVPPTTKLVRQEDFVFFQHFLCETVENIWFSDFDAKQWRGVEYFRRFERVEELSFTRSDLSSRCSLLRSLPRWYPNLKSLLFSGVIIGNNPFIEHSLPSVERVSFNKVKSLNTNYLSVLVIKNPQLKRLSVDLTAFPMDVTCMPIINEVLTELESLTCWCNYMSLPPTFRQNFVNLRELTFSSYEPSYKNELLPIIGYFPVLETLIVPLVPKLLMTNDDLIEFLTHGSSTLKEIVFSCTSKCIAYIELKFGYDLHRRICQATANHSEILIEFDFMFAGCQYSITKEWIKKNGQYSVLKDSING